MPERMQPFKMMPWVGGVNTSADKSQIAPNELTIADNILFAERGTRQIREGINMDWDDASNGSDSIIKIHDFWFGSSSRTQKVMAVTSGKKVYTYDSAGARSADLFAGTAWSSSVKFCSMVTFNNLAIIAVDGSGNVMKKWTGSGNIADLGGTPPQASIVGEHLSRLWTNDKTNLDRLHYSSTGNGEEWLGVGDSGAIDIGVGDGDPEGITAIFPTFKGDLFVAKRTKLYRITGYTPEDFQVIEVSKGIGCISHNSVALIDGDDCFFVSEKGVHSLATTNQYGDFAATFLSYPIQKTFNDNFTKSRLKYCQALYHGTKNLYMLAITDKDYSTSVNKAVWAFHLKDKVWHRPWANVSCESIGLIRESTGNRPYFGTNTARITRTFTGTKFDVDASGATAGISMKAKSGIIYVDGSEYTMKKFCRFALFYKAEGTHTIIVQLKIDNYPPQTLVYSQTASADLLGSTFTLGSSSLGVDSVLAPGTFSIEGYGRGIEITITQSNVLTEANVEIQGFCIDWEPAETRQSVVTSSQSVA
jgi:hypothetical protein